MDQPIGSDHLDGQPGRRGRNAGTGRR